MSICIILPAYNEENSIQDVISQLQHLKIKNKSIIVINDGSTDKTSQIAKQLNVSVIDLPFNLGIGCSVQTGLKYAQKHGIDTAVQLDADGQHDPKFLKQLLKQSNQNTHLVIGSRYINKSHYSTPFMRKLGILIFSSLINITCGKKIYDPTSGYRVFNKQAIDFLSMYYPIDFPEPESIVMLFKNGFTIKEYPVEMKARTAGSSSVTPFKAIYFMVSISISILIEAFKSKKIYAT